MWFNIASSNGDKDAVDWKAERENLMVSADIFEAQGMALKCMSSNYKNCGFLQLRMNEKTGISHVRQRIQRSPEVLQETPS